MTEREKMLAGEVYDACDPELLQDLNRVKVLCQQYNNLLPTGFAGVHKFRIVVQYRSPFQSLTRGEGSY